MLTREEIINASPSQINEWIDDYIMHERDKWLPPENWTGDISAAWELVEKMKEKFNEIQLYWFVHRWEVWFGSNETVENASAPLAICQAALLVVKENA